jgi:16S rRNA (cytosine967-C5)-methyltransferase
MGSDAVPTPLSPWGLEVKDVGKAAALVEEGLAAYQDEAAQLAVLALSPKRKERILDACSGRGGKTAAIGALTQNKATIVAVDRAPNKLERLAFELSRQQLSVTTLPVNLADGVDAVSGKFQRVLLDAPCSGTGTLGRRPEIRWRLEPRDIRQLVAIQKKLLENVAPLVATGGVLLYVVCSILPEEGIAQIEQFLEHHKTFIRVEDAPVGWPQSIPWNDGQICINPAKTRTDGYQMIALIKV